MLEIICVIYYGKYRNYMFKDLVVFRVINCFLKLGVWLKCIKVVILKFLEVCFDVIGDMMFVGMQLKFVQEVGYFIIDVESVLYVCIFDEIVDFIKNG